MLLLARGLRVASSRVPRRHWAAAVVLAVYVVRAAYDENTMARRYDHGWHHDRARMEHDLAARGGKHLVLVTYEPPYDFTQAWTYNGANIDEAPVVWASPLDAATDARLREYFHDRSAWRAHVSENTATLEPLPWGCRSESVADAARLARARACRRFRSASGARAIVGKKGMKQIAGAAALGLVVDPVLSENAKAVARSSGGANDQS